MLAALVYFYKSSLSNNPKIIEKSDILILPGVGSFNEAMKRLNKLKLVEDCAHAHGSSIKGIKAGAKSSGGAFSFFPTKVMTTMEGGMITTNDKFVYETERYSFWRKMEKLPSSLGLVLLDRSWTGLDIFIF